MKRRPLRRRGRVLHENRFLHFAELRETAQALEHHFRQPITRAHQRHSAMGQHLGHDHLTGNETIIVNGLMHARPGTKVKVEMVTLPPKAETAGLQQ